MKSLFHLFGSEHLLRPNEGEIVLQLCVCISSLIHIYMELEGA